MFEVFVIRPRLSSRAEPLLSALRDVQGIRVHEVDAVMLHSESELESVAGCIDPAGAEVRHGRMLLPQEFGCALAHNDARRRAGAAVSGSVVLEDDARIVNAASFVALVEAFLTQTRGRAALLNLYVADAREYGIRSSRGFVRRLAASPGAVAYALTPEAALRLLAVAEPVRHTADWPSARLAYYSATLALVTHGDSESGSLIHQGARTERTDSRDLGREVLTFRHYFANASEFSSPVSWFREMYEPRLRYWIDRIAMSVRRLVRARGHDQSGAGR